MKTYEEIKNMLFEITYDRRMRTADILKSFEDINEEFDRGQVERIHMLCDILGDYEYNSYTYQLRKLESEPEHIDMARKDGSEPDGCHYNCNGLASAPIRSSNPEFDWFKPHRDKDGCGTKVTKCSDCVVHGELGINTEVLLQTLQSKKPEK